LEAEVIGWKLQHSYKSNRDRNKKCFPITLNHTTESNLTVAPNPTPVYVVKWLST